MNKNTETECRCQVATCGCEGNPERCVCGTNCECNAAACSCAKGCECAEPK